MHEFSLATALCDIVLAEARTHAATCVHSVRCRVGILRQVVPELMQTAFTAAAAGTLAEGATLNLEVEPANVSCRGCGGSETVTERVHQCPACGSDEIVLTGGTDLLVAAMEIDQESNNGSPHPAPDAGRERRHR